MSTTIDRPPLTLQEMKRRLELIEQDVESLRDAIVAEEDIAAIDEAMASIDRGEGVPATEALAQLRIELGLPAARAATRPEANG